MELPTHIILDVDGTLTDSSVIYSDDGSETKTFSIRDGVAFAVLNALGVKIVVITGRACDATKRRMAELKAYDVHQGVRNKFAFIREYLDKNGLDPKYVCYVGDDINDYYAMKLVGTVTCPSDACPEVRSIADYVSSNPGGKGAFRDIVEHMLGTEKWMEVTKQLFG